MLHCSFHISNPLKMFKNLSFSKAIGSRECKLSTNKNFLVEWMSSPSTLLAFDLHLVFSGHDHAGPSIMITLFCYSLNIEIYDSRHWDYATNSWYKTPE